MRLGLYPDAPKKPFVPGYEVSGKVTAVGTSVTRRRRPAITVIAGTYFGGYASHVTMPGAPGVQAAGDGIDLATGAALPVNYFTAQLALFEMARVRAGDRVLIECATGGVGVLAIQMAQARRRRGHRPDDERRTRRASSKSSARRRYTRRRVSRRRQRCAATT